jgi:hypothetical protein
MSQLKVDTITDEAGTGSPSLPNGLTVGGVNYPSTGPLSNRNKIINGAMVIDQRNAGAAVTVNDGLQFFAVDRFFGSGVISDAVFTLQRDTSAPAGFSNSIKATVTTADASITENNSYSIHQRVEGFNATDFNFGTASAQNVTLSFWVRSSLTGSFGGSITNEAFDRVYPYSYSINAADTWEYKTVVIEGDTTGTWLKTNGMGLQVIWGLGAGSSRVAAAGAWTSTAARQSTGSTNLIATSGATFYITGVQLEAGTVATPFEHRSFGQELALCQRYFQVCRFGNVISAGASVATELYGQVDFFSPMRANPSAFLPAVCSFEIPYVGSPFTQSSAGIAVSSVTANGGGFFVLTGFSGLTFLRTYLPVGSNTVHLSSEL